jgi:hypothetical protein
MIITIHPDHHLNSLFFSFHPEIISEFVKVTFFLFVLPNPAEKLLPLWQKQISLLTHQAPFDLPPIVIPHFKLVLPRQKSSLFETGWTGNNSIRDDRPFPIMGD